MIDDPHALGAPRGGPDRCPGALRPHRAGDGALVRLRLPGGRITGRTFTALRSFAGAFGDGRIHLTSRANVQVRGLAVDGRGAVTAAAADALRTAGLLPSETHERVRNIVASPLSGVTGGRADVTALPARLDRLLRADPALARLPGRFLFGLDDGRGDIAALCCDVLAIATGPGRARIAVGEAVLREVPLAEAPTALIALAHRFLAIADGHWRVRELPGAGREIAGAAATALDPPRPPPVPYGRVGGAVSLLAPLGVLDPEQSAAIADAAGPDGAVVITPWRGAVIAPARPEPGVLARLTAAGLVTDAASPWARITACIGAPGCAKSAGDTYAAARALAEAGPPATATHIAGCPRACGAPRGDHTLTVLRSTP